MRVLIIADNMLARTGLSTLLSAEASVQVVGQVAGGDDGSLSNDLDVYQPDIVVYDLGYDPLPMISRLTDIVALAEYIPVLALLPDSDSAPGVVTALGNNGAYALLRRDTDVRAITAALHALDEGLISLDPVLADALIVPEAPVTEQLSEHLTPREFEVLQLLAEGLPNKIIAQKLGISPNTVKFHINAILNKLDAQSRTEAVVRATRLGLVLL